MHLNIKTTVAVVNELIQMNSQLVALFGINGHIIIQSEKREREREKNKLHIIIIIRKSKIQSIGDKNLLLCCWIEK